MRIVLLGDIVGRAGCRAVFFSLGGLRRSLGVDLVVANAENAVEGVGLDPQTYGELRRAGVDVVTSGNHVWQLAEIRPLLDAEDRLLRPENYPAGVPGHGVVTLQAAHVPVAVMCLEGRRFLSPLLCPFLTARQSLARLRPRPTVVVVDFHAEANDEKEALAFHLDGSVSAVVGTHTHVQTADERVLPGGTAYITDVGMTGPRDSVIGVQTEIILRRFLTEMPQQFSVADGVVRMDYVVIGVEGGCATRIDRGSELLEQ